MQPYFLARLGKPVQDFVLEVEHGAGVAIEVVLTPDLNDGGPLGQGNLEVIIGARQIQLYAPANGYLPDGAVRHEVLHVKRFHIDGVPQLVIADAADWDDGFAVALGRLDNAIEHLAIVPVELQLHPERRSHWEAVMQAVCDGLPDVPEEERSLAICMHWTFLRHVLPDSSQAAIMRRYAAQHALLDIANSFADQFLSVVNSKEDSVRLLFDAFPQIGRNRSALNYINSIVGKRQRPVP